MYRKWSTLKKLIWLKYTGAIGGAVWKTVTGAIVTFVTNLINPLRLTASLDPVQDLHGYDSPWPAGGGRNKLNPTTATGSSITWLDVTLSSSDEVISFSGTATGNGGRTELKLKTIHLAAGRYYISASSTTGTQPTVIVQTVSGSTYTVIMDRANAPFDVTEDSDIVVGFNLISGTTYSGSMKLQIESGSTPTAYSPYANLCPISGHTGVTVYRTGGNLYDSTTKTDNYFISENGKITANTDCAISDFIPVDSNSRCFVSGVGGTYATRKRFHCYDESKTWISQLYFTPIISSGTEYEFNVSIPQNAKYVRLSFGKEDTDVTILDATTYPITFPAFGANKFGPNTEPIEGKYIGDSGDLGIASGWTVSDYIAVKPNTQYAFNPNITEGDSAKSWFYTADKEGISYINSGPRSFTTPSNCAFMRFSYRSTSTNIMLNEGSSALPYEPYTNTVYGGSGDVVSGEWENGYGIFDLGEINYSYSSSGGYFYASASSLPNCKVFPNNVIPDAWCSCYKIRSTSDIGASSVLYGIALPGGSYVRLKDARTTDPSTLKTLLSGQKIVYPLATPVPFTTTPTPITTLKGTNTIWVDNSDEISVTYRQS